MCNSPTNSMFQLPLPQSTAAPVSQALQEGAFVLQPPSVVHQDFCSLEAPLLRNIPRSERLRYGVSKSWGQLLPELNNGSQKCYKVTQRWEINGNYLIFQTSVWTLGWSSVRYWDDSVRMFGGGTMAQIDGFYG